VHGPAHGDDAGYRVDLDAYALPPMELSAAQLGVLGLAADFWQDQSLRTDAARALTKLRVVGDTSADTDAVVGLAPRLHAAGPALAPLLDAAHARQAVEFTYRAASTGEVLRRTVEPWRIIASRGGWYLVGFDTGREAPRVFRLSRIVDDVVPVGLPGAFVVPDGVDPMAMLAASQQGETRLAWLSVAADRAGALRSRAVEPGDQRPPARPRPGHDLLVVPFERSADLAEELLGYADAVVVLEPEDLRADVVGRLREAVLMADRLAGGERGSVDG
jgi:proteasome accessory factor B